MDQDESKDFRKIIFGGTKSIPLPFIFSIFLGLITKEKNVDYVDHILDKWKGLI